MGSILSRLFGKPRSQYSSATPLTVDMHSHVLPGLDDGSASPEQSIELLQHMHRLGYRKLVMTPHIMGDFYKNTPEGVREKLAMLKQVANQAGIDMDLHCAAEYYLDEWFIAKLENKVEMLTFGEPRYLLFETSFINKPINFDEAVFLMKSAGYIPVLAHPERYTYLYSSLDKVAELRERGVLLQININSLSGYYSPAAQKVAERMIDDKIVDFAGTDTHNLKHLKALERARDTKYYGRLLQLPLLNNTL